MSVAVLKPMMTWRIPRWVLPAALAGVLAMTAADVILLRRHRVTVRPRARAMLQQARPSPFERTKLEIVVTQTLPAPVNSPELAAQVQELAAASARVAAAEPPRESRLDRVISRIPLLRRLRKHPQSDENELR
jgi:hypothetical protein